MKWFVVLLLVTLSSTQKRDTYDDDSVSVDACLVDDEAVQVFTEAYHSFGAKFCAIAAHKGHYYFTVSPHEIWITLAAIAEGADQALKKQLFTLLNLPDDLCSREKMYQIATRPLSNNHVNLDHTRALVIDETPKINPFWYNIILQNSLLQVIEAPFKTDPDFTAAIIKQIISSQTEKLNLNGNSVILNSIDYNGLWTTAFADAVIKRAPFYSRTGHKIGSVDLMKVRRKVRTGYLASLNMKVIEIPIGGNREYSMIFGLVVDNDASLLPVVEKWGNHTLKEMLLALDDNYVPVDISIPKFVITSEINVREILEDMGVTRLWNVPGATRYISTPAAYPSDYIQRATLTLSNKGVNQPTYEFPSFARNDQERYWKEFVADRPFAFMLFDNKAYTCVMFTMYSKPTYTY